MKSWMESMKIYGDRRMMTILLLGFSSGLPLLLVFSTLSYWLKDEGLSKSAIGLFSLVRTPYGLKFLWAPVIDRLSVPKLGKLIGHRKSWALITQIGLMAAIAGMAMTQPAMTPTLTAIFAIGVAFFSASQDIVIDAFRIEILKDDEQGAGSAMVVLGYRIGMLFAGAGALWMATYFDWNTVYLLMAASVVIGMVTIMCAKEPASSEEDRALYEDTDIETVKKYYPTLGLRAQKVGAFLHKAVWRPLTDFMQHPGWYLILLFILLYKLCETFLGAMVNPFYVEMGFSKAEIASIIKVFGMSATIIGGILGGVFVKRYGIMKALFICGVLQGLANLMYAAQAMVGYDVGFLTLTISVENVTAGMATTAFVAYMSSLCSVAYTATQYALLSSLMAISRDVIASTSGIIADSMNWVSFFVFTSMAAIPGLILLIVMMKKFPPKEKTDE